MSLTTKTPSHFSSIQNLEIINSFANSIIDPAKLQTVSKPTKQKKKENDREKNMLDSIINQLFIRKKKKRKQNFNKSY